jgi:hypothetical protein
MTDITGWIISTSAPYRSESTKGSIECSQVFYTPVKKILTKSAKYSDKSVFSSLFSDNSTPVKIKKKSSMSFTLIHTDEEKEMPSDAFKNKEPMQRRHAQFCGDADTDENSSSTNDFKPTKMCISSNIETKRKKNRLAARKSRQKTKELIHNLKNEIARLKQQIKELTK